MATRGAAKAGFSQHWRQRFLRCLYLIIVYDAASTVLEIYHQLLSYVGRAILYFRTPGERRISIFHALTTNEKGKDASSPCPVFLQVQFKNHLH